MWQILALCTTFIGVIVIYLTNKHQVIIHKPLSKMWSLVAYSCWLLSLISWLQIYVVSAAFFIWLFILSTALVCIPLLSLAIKEDNKNTKGNYNG